MELDLEKKGTKIVKNGAAHQPVFEEDVRIQQIAHVVDYLSQFFGFPVDVEASFDSDQRLVILQVRPITTVGEALERGRALLVAESEPELDAASIAGDTKGGIDFSVLSFNLEVQKAAEQGLAFEFDDAMISQLRDISGFTPVIINVRPIVNLQEYLAY